MKERKQNKENKLDNKSHFKSKKIFKNKMQNITPSITHTQFS